MLVRMTSDLIRPPEKRYNYSNAFAGLVHLIREEGFHGLARGLGTNMVCHKNFFSSSFFEVSHLFLVSCSFDERAP